MELINVELLTFHTLQAHVRCALPAYLAERLIAGGFAKLIEEPAPDGQPGA